MGKVAIGGGRGMGSEDRQSPCTSPREQLRQKSGDSIVGAAAKLPQKFLKGIGAVLQECSIQKTERGKDLPRPIEVLEGGVGETS